MGTSDLVALSAVAEREGWTLAAVKRFLHRADHVEAFPTYTRRYYRLSRIEAIEQSAEWLAYQAKKARGKQASYRPRAQPKRAEHS